MQIFDNDPFEVWRIFRRIELKWKVEEVKVSMLPLRNPKIECREHYQESGPVRLSPNEKLVLLVRHGEGTHNCKTTEHSNS